MADVFEAFRLQAQSRLASVAIIVGAMAFPAMAQMTPVGLWRHADDKSGEAKADIRIVQAAGVLSGRIDKRLGKDVKPDDTCEQCSGDRKDKPITGLEIIRGAKNTEGKDAWEGGKILDPENGRNYALRMVHIDAEKKLEVRGSWGPFGRTQTWTRIN